MKFLNISQGIADPSQIALLFWLDSALESLLYLDGIVTVVDSVNFEKQLTEEAASNSGTVTKQIAVADSLYLSKIDLAPASKVNSVKLAIQAINNTALINHSDEDLETVLAKILHLDSFSTFLRIPKSLRPYSGEAAGSKDLEVGARLTREVGNLTAPNFRTAHDSFSTITIDLPILENIHQSDGKFDKTFRKLIWEGSLDGDDNTAADLEIDKESRILRAKGLLKDLGGRWFILQAVRDTYEVQPIDSDDVVGHNEQPRLVLIGKNLNDQLKQRFLEAIL